MEKTQNCKRFVFNTIQVLIIATLFLWMPVSCGSDNDGSDPKQSMVPGKVTGSVKDETGNAYPNTLVKLKKGIEQHETRTDFLGNFVFDTKNTGDYKVTLIPPLSAMAVTENPVTVNVLADQASTVDFVIQPQPLEADLVIGQADIFGEIKDKDGNIPVNPETPIYASNVFDAPLGKLTATKAPDDHHVTLSEWQNAQGNVMVSCNGTTATVDIALQGMIPNGTYTLWCNFLNKVKKAGQSVDFAADNVAFKKQV